MEKFQKYEKIQKHGKVPQTWKKYYKHSFKKSYVGLNPLRLALQITLVCLK